MVVAKVNKGSPSGSVAKNPPAMQECSDTLNSGSGRSLGGGCGSLPGESHGQRRLAGYSPWGLQRVRYD